MTTDSETTESLMLTVQQQKAQIDGLDKMVRKLEGELARAKLDKEKAQNEAAAATARASKMVGTLLRVNVTIAQAAAGKIEFEDEED